MSTFITIAFISTLIYQLIQFARQEYFQDEYEATVDDIEGRMDWARSRSTFPFGMKAQLEVSSQLLGEAKNLWSADKWPQALSAAMQSQEAMDRAQSIYSITIQKQLKTSKSNR